MEVSWKSVAVFLLVCFLTSQLVIHREVASHENSAQFRLKCPERMEAVIGETKILLCATEPQTSVTRVEWTVNETTDVHLNKRGKDYLQDQALAYKGRTTLFNQELSKGNCSLKLMVLPFHAGTYQCFVKNGNDEDSCSLNLIVHEKGEQRNGARSKSSFDFKKAALSATAIASAVFLLFYHFCPRH